MGTIYYGSIVGNGIVEAGQPEAGIKYCDTAIQTAATMKDIGFPFMAYEGKARGLIALQRNGEARQVLDQAIHQAQAQNALAAEAQLLVVRGEREAGTDSAQAIRNCKRQRPSAKRTASATCWLGGRSNWRPLTATKAIFPTRRSMPRWQNTGQKRLMTNTICRKTSR